MLETHVQIGDKMSAHGRVLEKGWIGKHPKGDFSSEKLCKIVFIRFEMNVPILDKMTAHGRSFDNKIHFGIWNDIIGFE